MYVKIDSDDMSVYISGVLITLGTEDGGSDCVGNICRAVFLIWSWSIYKAMYIYVKIEVIL